jgi:O-antigen/teichoic acid export membrane protein
MGRELGVDGLGKINLIALSLSTCNLILNLGIGQSLVYYNSKSNKNSIILNSFVITLFISAFSVIIFLIFSRLIKNHLPNISLNWLYTLIIISPFIHLKNLAEYYYASVGNFSLNSGLNFVDLFLKLILSYFLVFLFPALDAFFYSIIFVSILIGLLPWVKILAEFKLNYVFKVININAMFSLLSYGIPSYLSVLVAFLSLRIDQLLIGTFMTNKDLGIYIVAVIFAELPFKFSNAITKVLFVKVSSKTEYSSIFTTKTLRMILFISMVIIIVILLIGDYLIKSLYGDYFHEVYSVLILLLPGSFFFNITQILSSDLSGRGYPSFGMKSGIVVLLVSIGFNLVFISRYGLISVAIISSLTYFLGAIILIFYFLKITKSTFKQMFLIRKSDFKFNIIDES